MLRKTASLTIAKALVACAALAVAASAAHATSFSVNGTAAVYGAGLGGNGLSTAPYSFDFAAGAGQVLTFSSVTGATNCCSGSPTSPPDGSSGGTSVTALNGISGITAPNIMFLAGVFIDSTNLPSSGNEPTSWNYNIGPFESDASFSGIGLNRVFFIGDGLTGSGAGSTQNFYIPVNADRLLLGFVDSYGFNGSPSYYGDNTGSLTGDFAIAGRDVTAVPLPGTLPLFAAGLGALGLLGRRKMRKAAVRAAA